MDMAKGFDKVDKQPENKPAATIDERIRKIEDRLDNLEKKDRGAMTNPHKLKTIFV